METAYRKISSRIDKENSIIVVLAGNRNRTWSGKDIIEQRFRDDDFDMWDDDGKNRQDKEHWRIGGMDILNDKGGVLPTDDPEHSEKFKAVHEEIEAKRPEDVSNDKYMRENSLKNLESFESIGTRAKKQLSGYKRIAHSVQPKLDKQIVIVQVEHGETLDDFYENASQGKYTKKSDSGAEKGEVVEVVIPSEGDELDVNFIDRDDQW